MQTLVRTIGIVATAVHLGVTLPMLAVDAAGSDGSESLRKGRWELILGPQYTLAKNLGFDGGTTAKVDDSLGFALQIGYNLNDHWNLAGQFSWSNPDYHAVVQPAAGTPGGPLSRNGTFQTSTFALAVTYHFFAGPLTPYVDANVGGSYVNTDVASGPPVVGCYYDPWYGNFCSSTQPTKADTFLSYGVGGGLRWDVNSWLLLRAGVRQQWIDLSHTGSPSFTAFKLDVGFKF